jgi:hypothetical protein
MENPCGSLAVPEEDVAEHVHLMLFSKGYKLISCIPFIGIRFGVDTFPFEGVFQSDGVEVLRYDLQFRVFGLVKLGFIDGSSDEKIVGKAIPKWVRGNFLSPCWD